MAIGDLEALSIAEIVVSRDLNLVACHGSGLYKLGATATVTAADPPTAAQAWSQAIYHHPSQVDGIVYRVRHDNDQFGFALFDRCASDLDWVHSTQWILSNHLNAICDRYDVIL